MSADRSSPEVQSAIAATTAEVEALSKATLPSSAGASVTFSGVVRNHDEGRGVSELEYVAHPSAHEILSKVAWAVAIAHPQVSAVRVAHRVGVLGVGDLALYAEVCSPHRAEAFAACSDLVERVKDGVPIWKRQVFTDGTQEWVNSP